jgi:hypothetical protein
MRELCNPERRNKMVLVVAVTCACICGGFFLLFIIGGMGLALSDAFGSRS